MLITISWLFICRKMTKVNTYIKAEYQSFFLFPKTSMERRHQDEDGKKTSMQYCLMPILLQLL